jgi:uncharacterized membrane protein
METIEKTIDIDLPVRTVYNQWTQFEDFPRFMEGVRVVRQLDDKRLHWEAVIGGKEKEWTAEIFEQEPDRRIAWRSTSGAMNSGRVDFLPVNEQTTRVTLHLNYEPEGVVENVGNLIGVVSARVAGDLERFKSFIERRGSSPGWRGEIQGRDVKNTGGSPQ